MQVGEETIKWHVKNLFAKLDAGTRKQVVQRARILGLLKPGDLSRRGGPTPPFSGATPPARRGHQGALFPILTACGAAGSRPRSSPGRPQAGRGPNDGDKQAMNPATQSSIQVEPLTCSIGAELSNVNLGAASRDPELVAEIRALLLKHKVLFFRDQDITRAEHVAFARHFGELEDHPVAGSDPEHPGPGAHLQDRPTRPTTATRTPGTADATWREKPPFGCVLRCVECPPVGGDTMWANMVLAYEKLPAEHQGRRSPPCAPATASRPAFGAAMPIEKRLALHAQFPDAEHPVVRTHPETGEKVLFVNAFTTHFTNFHTPENVRYGQDYSRRRPRCCCTT